MYNKQKGARVNKVFNVLDLKSKVKAIFIYYKGDLYVINFFLLIKLNAIFYKMLSSLLCYRVSVLYLQRRISTFIMK